MYCCCCCCCWLVILLPCRKDQIRSVRIIPSLVYAGLLYLSTSWTNIVMLFISPIVVKKNAVAIMVPSLLECTENYLDSSTIH